MFDGIYKQKYYRNADYYTACSQWVKNGMAERGVNPLKTTVTHNSIDTGKYWPIPEERIRFREKHAISQDCTVVVGIGSFVECKGFNILIDSFAQLAPSIPNLHLLLAGDGPMRKHYIKRIEELDLSKRITISDSYIKDIRPWLWASDIFVLPSIAEPFGNIVLEAMAAGLPAIVTDDGGPSEIIKDGVDGFIIPSGDASAISETIRKILRLNPADKNAILENSRKRLEYFSSAALADRLIRVYDHVLKNYRQS